PMNSASAIQADKQYAVTGWGCTNEGVDGPPIWDAVEQHVANTKIVRAEQSVGSKWSGCSDTTGQRQVRPSISFMPIRTQMICRCSAPGPIISGLLMAPYRG